MRHYTILTPDELPSEEEVQFTRNRPLIGPLT